MAYVLSKIGIRKEVQDFVKDEFVCLSDGTLAFKYGHEYEFFNLNRHIVPVSDILWMAGYQNISLVRQVYIFNSAIEALAYLSLHYDYLGNLDNILIISIGLCPSPYQLHFIVENFKKRKILLVFGNDCLGRILDLKVIGGIIQLPIQITYQAEELFKIQFRNKVYFFKMEELTLSSFQICTGVRSKARTLKPKKHNTFLHQITDLSTY